MTDQTTVNLDEIPRLNRPAFRPMTEAEAEAVRGGLWVFHWGTCVVGGYACWEEGGAHWGACAIFGTVYHP